MLTKNTIKKLHQVADLGVLTSEEVDAIVTACNQNDDRDAIQRKAITYAEAEHRTGLSRWTLLRAVKNGELSVFEVGTRRLFDLAELDEWLESKKVTHL